jgi:gamma-glutamyl:cysteine ligase YbdK (ATP-grasp superfamily)
MVLYLKYNQPPTFYAFSEFIPFSQDLDTLLHCSSWHIIRELPGESVIKSFGLSFVPSFMRLGQLERKLRLRTCIETVRGLWRTFLEHAKTILGDIHTGIFFI